MVCLRSWVFVIGVGRAIEKIKHDSQFGYFDLVYDWYSLSVCNTVLTWRKGYGPSTFVWSAQRISGTTDRSNIRTGVGFGSKGYQLSKKRNQLNFQHFWMYSFLEQYQKP